ncbi:putative ribonuclease H-like domain-containing protein [Tanacetum coccineum]
MKIWSRLILLILKSRISNEGAMLTMWVRDSLKKNEGEVVLSGVFQAEVKESQIFALMAYTSKGSQVITTLVKSSWNQALRESDLKLKLENFEESSKNLTKLINSQISAKDKAGLGYDSQINESEVVNSVFNSKESDVDDSPVNDRFKTGEGFHAVLPPLHWKYMPSRPDLSFAGLDDSVYKAKVSETITIASKTSKDSLEKPKTVRPSAPIIEDWDTDSDNDSVFRPKPDQTKPKFTKINFVKSNEKVKSVNKENTHRQEEYPRKSQVGYNRRIWNGMMTRKLGNGFEFIKKSCFVCGSFNHLIKDCDYHDNKMVKKPVLNNKGRVTGQREIRLVWNNAQRLNYQNKLTHPHPKRKFVPTAVLTKSGQVPVKQSSLRAATSISTARTVNIAAPKLKMNDALPKTPLKKSQKRNGNPQYTLQDQRIFDSGMLLEMTGYKSFLYSLPKVDVDCVCDLQEVPKEFNLFSASQMCDKKNSFLFTKTECLALSPDFKLLDESQVLLKVPRQNNMHNFDLKNVVPSGCLTCLFAKAIIDESNLWHRRLGHIKFKTMNKLVRGNLVRGLPSKLFENDHTCVACQKGKQHKASCKTKVCELYQPPIASLPYGLIWFSWVFFLATKDETSRSLTTFITGIENQINHKVKIIRCDNRTEFKNNDMNQFCGIKGIKREFSVARTPQQNGVAERKNRTLIEAARTMLADSLLPTTFWVKVVILLVMFRIGF